MKEILKPVIVLAVICLVMTAVLASVNQITQPVIIEAEKKAAAAARTEVLSEAKEFEKIDTDDIEALPEGVEEAYKGSDDSGYVFIVETKGYGGKIKFICGIRNDGTMEAVKTLSHTETSGVGTKAVDNGSDYRKNFFGKSREECAGVDTITGATISSAAFKKAVGIAFDAYDAVKETER